MVLSRVYSKVWYCLCLGFGPLVAPKRKETDRLRFRLRFS